MENIKQAGALSMLLLIGLSAVSLEGPKVVAIAWIAFTATVLGGLFAGRDNESVNAMVWSYGLSGGAALASILFFVLPQALDLSRMVGATGVLAGFLSGLALHTLSHELSHSRKGLNTFWSVSIHSAAAGLVIGLIYQQMPTVSILLGIAIVSHKLPAGYMVADRLRKEGKNYWPALLVPASGVGVMSLLSFNYPLALSEIIQALFFGFSAGIFLHVALDFLPDPEPESHLRKLLHAEEDPLHMEMDEVRFHSVASTVCGAALVAALALLL
ncbi:MAG: ZIP family metal transporter [Candidatus Nanohaloarchaea archaeon]